MVADRDLFMARAILRDNRIWAVTDGEFADDRRCRR
jgi:hypothetical protein